MEILEDNFKQPEVEYPREANCFVCRSVFRYEKEEAERVVKREEYRSTYWFKFYDKLNCPCCTSVINLELKVEEKSNSREFFPELGTE